ncbi:MULTISPECIES: tRNA lysidine(34) synthetase TilS [Chryseobacterium]|uniref:tRNA(Ile)-lysidine synthase n=1 Tax=Chryseobacterium camelliae TaxID=1265445 RepID=A0ABU0TL72_9FLAO|nr:MULTISPECIES: tRNA lysidine(34) synthetase TilS [Chryseobacterium]MDT3408348.1 tRNA(Ile)-lysidine synthase [Pseudacidovorax intermedius]MDQ1097795.1 tRNA(Ile)-lysidine synthase [Chryseobacterium camelliae]MDQ1101727.1 tRNA(Ile)-lysidine synthase [Chryseobacterium sp. SORGH_AS_1048]MDR6085166.1 tRNA(Ile)-lysidine synthase [Chryseobacterium sp. SORGH_AS_0909]MDR6129525.1 tRNA(Ile)-lysidine synthase [Chryseobacterium sp. SORGH_AS_1175]
MQKETGSFMLEKWNFVQQLENLVASPSEHTYLLAVSGGADSMVLAHLFKLTGQRFAIAHINYGLRGEDSELDQKVVQDFCDRFNIHLHLYTVTEKDRKPEHSIQLWAREIRYRFFREVQDQHQLEFLVTAHHLNDQLETFIINLSKAAGIRGLSGIPASANGIIRPLLSFSKEEIYRFAQINGIEYREDKSNAKNDYLRNSIRNEIVPKLMTTHDDFLGNFRKSIFYLNQAKDFVDEQISAIEKQISFFNKGCKILSKKQLSRQSDFVKFEILKKYGFTAEEEIPKIFTAENGSVFFSKDYQLTVYRDELTFIPEDEKHNKSDDRVILVENFDFSENRMVINLEDNIKSTEEMDVAFEWYFDAEKLKLPLKLRRQMDGDEFFPSGFSGKKKVSKFFRDEKLSILARQKIWILADGDNTVLGIVPLRQDRRYEGDEKTNKILKIFNKRQNEI